MLGDFEFQVLSAIVASKNEAYGKVIKTLIEDDYDRTVNYGALYATLSRLENKGYISSEMTAATAVRGGRRKKSYSITGLGQSAHAEKNNFLKRLQTSKSGGAYA